MSGAKTGAIGDDSGARNRSQRRLILLLLALNLFLGGALGAFLARSYLGPSVYGHPPGGKHNIGRRIDALAERLEPGDAAVLRAEFAPKSAAAQAAEEAFCQSRDRVRQALRAEPFDPNAVRTAMSEAGAARRSLEQIFHDVIVSAAEKLTPQGRATLADWPRPPRNKYPALGAQRRPNHWFIFRKYEN